MPVVSQANRDSGATSFSVRGATSIPRSANVVLRFWARLGAWREPSALVDAAYSRRSKLDCTAPHHVSDVPGTDAVSGAAKTVAENNRPAPANQAPGRVRAELSPIRSGNFMADRSSRRLFLLFVAASESRPLPVTLERAKSVKIGSLLPAGDGCKKSPCCPTMTCKIGEGTAGVGSQSGVRRPSLRGRALGRLALHDPEARDDESKAVTELLLSLRDGDRSALNELVPLVYSELRRIARNKLRLERQGHTLNTTALVNEAYLQLVEIDPSNGSPVLTS